MAWSVTIRRVRTGDSRLGLALLYFGAARKTIEHCAFQAPTNREGL